MTTSSAGPDVGVGVRDLLSSLDALRGLSTVMIDAGDEDEILCLALGAVPSLGHGCRVEGIWLDGRWRVVESPRGRVGHPPGLEGPPEVPGDGGGGMLSSAGHGWLYAFPVTSRGGAEGCLVVASPEAPPEHEQALLRALAHQTGVAISQSRLFRREREMHSRIADEQATLRRVASMVSRAAPPEEVFAAVAGEAGRLLDADFAVMSRYAPDGSATVVGAWAKLGTQHPFPTGSRIEGGGTSVHALVHRTGRPSRVEDYPDDQIVGSVARQWAIGSVVGVPIHIGGHLWGAIGVATRDKGPLPASTEGWLSGFTELVATAIANAQAQVELRGYAEEQAALRRVATLVARAASPEDVFDAVAAEIGKVLDVDFTVLSRYEDDGCAVVIGGWNKVDERRTPVGARLGSSGHNLHALVLESGRPARIDDYVEAFGPAADFAREFGFSSAVGAPILVDGRLWGIASVAIGRPDSLPADTELRLTEFTELVATAVGNAHAHAELTDSRARIVAAADDTRRRIERDLHDGAQQRLVSLALQLRAVQSAAPAGSAELVRKLDGIADGMVGVMEELLEIARGIHPGILADGGLRPALKTLARRSALHVTLDVTVDGRLPEQVELAAYYAVAEALTNAAKHARATGVDVSVKAGADFVHVCVSDDGCGGADIDRGSGLEGLKDRVRTLSGRMALYSPPGRGTILEIALPLQRQP